jgi:hypothetical protein
VKTTFLWLVAACGSAPRPVSVPDVPEVPAVAPSSTAMLATSDGDHVLLVEVLDRVMLTAERASASAPFSTALASSRSEISRSARAIARSMAPR